MKLNVTRSNTALLALVRVALTCAVLAPTMDVAAQTPSSTTIEPVADGTVRSIVPFGNDGDSQVLSVSAASIISLERSLVRFDQAAIASALQGKQLVSATLEFTVPTLATSWLGGRIGLHRMVRPWEEQGATWSCANDTYTGTFGDLFNNCSSSNRWGMSWFSWYPDPYEATSTDEAQVFATSGDTVTFDVSSDIAAYLAGTSNHGWAIVGTQDVVSGEWIQFGSRESTNPARLILTHSAPPAPPSTADTISLEVVATEDSFVSELFPNWAREGSTRLKANSDQALFTKHALVQFRDGDIANQMAAVGVSGDYELESAHVVLTVRDRWPLLNVGQPIDIHRVVSPWEALGATWNCAVDTNPGNIFFANCSGSTAWDMDAANPASRPYEPAPTDSALAVTNYGGEMLFDVAADVSTFLDGSTQNNGWLIRKPDQPWLGFISFFSIEGGVPPRLELTFRLRQCTAATPCEVAGPCLDDSECVADLSCRTDVAWRFDAAQGFGVCWDDVFCGDVDHPDYSCGSLTDRCGLCPQCEFCSQCPCEVGDPCDPADALCAPFLECRDGQCWDPIICDDLSSALFECGTEDALCGPICPQCSPSCDGLACGYDGCIGRCGDAICDDGERGCESHADCSDGLACIPEPGGVGTCRPEHCDHPGLNPCAFAENAGTVTECGECPVCVPSCAGRSCGDDGCGGSCGSAPTGEFCTDAGQSASLIPLALDTWADDADWLEDPFPYDGETVPGTVPGQLSVTDFGQAAYSIPIAVPPGRNGMQPNLSLNYNSSSGDGYLGIGWGLSGLSAIQRCAKTIAQDGAPAPITYTDSDRFCLDGRRLVLEDPSQTYGADGTWYRTEQETFSRVLLSEPSEQGPGRFVEYMKDGTIRTFDNKVGGATAIGETSLHPPNYSPDDSSEPIVTQTWNLTLVEDRLGNSMKVTHSAPKQCITFLPVLPTSGGPLTTFNTCISLGGTVREVYPSRISYTHHQDRGASRYVNFEYRFRTDLHTGYLRGARFERTFVLDQIDSGEMSTTGEDRTVFRYKFAYHDSEGREDRTTLDSVTQCARRGLKESHEGLTCKPPTTFQYHRTQPGFTPTADSAFPDYNFAAFAKAGPALVLDMDGDGKDDLLTTSCFSSECSSATLNLHLGDGPEVAPATPLRWTTPTHSILIALDYNMDGRDNILEMRPATSQVGTEYRVWSLIDGVLGAAPPKLSGLHPTQNVFAADLNGDQVTDLVTRSTLSSRVIMGRPGEFLPTEVLGQIYSRKSPFAMDITGDGREEIFMSFNGTRAAFMSPGAGTSTGEFTANDATNLPAAARIPMDVNGDSLPDIVEFTTNRRIRIWANTGAGFILLSEEPIPESLHQPDSPWNYGENIPNIFLPFDENGDGRMDLLIRPDANVDRDRWVLLSSNGKSFDVKGLPADLAKEPAFPSAVMDLDHDGIRDLRLLSRGWLRKGPPETRLRSATNGLGARVELYYASLNQGTYTSGDDHPVGIPSELDPEQYLPTPYIQHTSEEDCSYPCYPRHPTGTVVRTVATWDKVDDGVIDPVRYQVYTYGGAATDLEGRGSLGFSLRTVQDSALQEQAQAAGTTIQPISARQYDNLYYDEETHQYPMVGRANSIISGAGAGPSLTRSEAVTQKHKLIRPTPNSIHVYAEETEQTTKEGDVVIRSSVTTTEQDEYGNPVSIETVWNDSADGNDTDVSKTTILYNHSLIHLNAWLTGVPSRILTTSKRGSREFEGRRVIQYVYASNSLVLPTDIINGWDFDRDLHTSIAYDAYGNPIEIALSGDTQDGRTTRTTQITYDDEGLFPHSVTNALGHVVEFDYDRGLGVPLRVIADGKPGKKTTTASIPDGFGRPRRLVDPAGNFTRIDYQDPSEFSSTPGGILIRTERDGSPAQMAVLDVLGRPAGEAIQDFDASTPGGSPSGLLIASREYNALGSVARANGFYDPQGGGVRQDTLYGYDSLGRMIRQELPNGSVVERCYKENVICTRDPRNYSHCQVYNEHGQLAHSIQPNSSDQRTCQEVLLEVWQDFPAESAPAASARFDGISYEYGNFDQLEKIINPLQSANEFFYDVFGRITRTEDPNAGTSHTGYNGFDEVEFVQSASGDATRYHHDNLGRVISRTEHMAGAATGDERVTSYLFDEVFGEGFAGQLILSGDDDGAVQINTFDDAGRLTQFYRQVPTSSEFGTFKRQMTYDSAGRLSLVSYNSVNGPGEPLAYRHHYNDDGYLSSIQLANPLSPTDASTDQMLWEISATDAYGRIALESFANGQQTTREYWANTGRLRRQSTQAGSVFAQDWRYEYDANQNAIERIDGRSAAEETTQYTYDHLGRLTAADSFAGLPGGGGASTHLEAYTYDVLGNIMSRGTTNGALGTSASWTYNYESGGGNRLLSVSDGAVDSAFEYDDAGRVTKRIGDLQASLGILYNAQGMPTALGQDLDTTAGLTGATTLDYDAFGARTRKSSLDGETLYLDDAFRRVSSATASGLEEHLTISGGGHAIAEIIRDASGTDHVQYLHTGVLGSVDAVTDASGTVVEERRHEAFGKVRSAAGGAAYGVKPGFTGHEFDGEYGLVNMKARLYDPEIGRFLTPDPLLANPSQVQGINPYSYVNNNPVRFTDPSGMTPCDGGFYCPQGNQPPPWEEDVGQTPGPPYSEGGNISDYDRRHLELQQRLQAADQKRAEGRRKARAEELVKANAKALAIRNTRRDNLRSETRTFDARSVTSSPLGAGGGGMPTWDAVFDAQPGGFKDYEERSHQLVTAPFELFSTIMDGPAILLMWGGLKVLGTQGVKHAVMAFGQASVKNTFAHGAFAGKTIGAVAKLLRAGKATADQLPVEFIVRNGQRVALNNRSLLTLRRAGLKPTILINRTGVARYEKVLDAHLRGGVPSTVIRVRGGAPGTSLIE